MLKKSPHRIAVFIFVISVLLSGCGMAIDREVTFYDDEAWEAEMRIGISNEMLAMYGSPETIEGEMRTLVEEMEQAGANASWKSRREDTGYQYDISVEGEGLSLLSDIVFGSSAQIEMVEVDGRQAIYFNAMMTGDILGASQNIVTIHGGEILNSNGTPIDSGTVQWINPTGAINATLTPKGGFNFGTFLIIVLAAVVIGGVGWYFWKQTTQPPADPAPSKPPPAAPPPPASPGKSVFCVYCGETIDSAAKFCPHCGKNQMMDSE